MFDESYGVVLQEIDVKQVLGLYLGACGLDPDLLNLVSALFSGPFKAFRG